LRTTTRHSGVPLYAYAFGLIDRWASAVSLAPQLANFVANAPGASHFLGRLLHIATQRRLPRVANQPFRRWAQKVGIAAPGAALKSAETLPEVILWADTLALMRLTDEESLLRKMGAEVSSHDSGCCGMAGPFGFDLD
jgi:hypothetical protein